MGASSGASLARCGPAAPQRAIDNLAVQALIAAFADGKGIGDENAAKAAVTEVTNGH